MLSAEPSWDQGRVVVPGPQCTQFSQLQHCPLAWVLRQLESGRVGTGCAASLMLGCARAALGICRASLQVVTYQLSLGTLFLMQGFGRADHAVTTEKLKAEYPNYEITWADEGY